MKKTFSLSIGGLLFHVEEDAYERLEAYLGKVRDHFADDPNGKEILADIESRIAEKFSEKKMGIIMLSDVDAVIEAMGTVEQFDDEKEAAREEKQSTPKKLFRDPDNAIIAGVSSGLGHFFGIDPIIFRLIFALSIFLGGTGIIVYILLWILVPEAKTSSQKLSMKGSPATISAMADMIKEKIDEVNTPEHKNALKKFVEDVLRVLRKGARFIGNTLFPFIRISLGVLITMIAFALAVGATMAFIFSLFHISPSIIEGPFLELANTSTFKVLVTSTYLVALIPLIFIVSLGGYMMTKRAILSRVGIVSLLALWFVAIPIAGATGTKIGIRSAEILNTDPYYKRELVVENITPFSELIVTDDQSVKIVQGDTYKLAFNARPQDLAHVVHTLEGNTLTISELDTEKSTTCLMCGGEYVEITVTVPTLSSIIIKDSAHLSGDVTAKTLSLALDNSSSASLDIKADAVTGSIEDSSRIYMRGTVPSMSMTLANNSRLDGWQTEVRSADIKTANSSYASVYATKELKATAMNGSTIEYRGNPKLEETIDASSRLENMDGSTR